MTYRDPKTNEQFTDERTDGEIANVLMEIGTDFARSLASQSQRWSEKQRAWAYKLVREHEAPKASTQSDPLANATIDASAIIALFAMASNHIKYPAIDFYTERTGVVQFKRVNSGANEGCVNITNGLRYQDPERQFYGRVQTDGTLKLGWGMSDSAIAIRDLIDAFAKNPSGVVAAHGKSKGACVICGNALTDDRSTAAGYGPTCAKNWGLPWGQTTILPTDAPDVPCDGCDYDGEEEEPLPYDAGQDGEYRTHLD